MREEPEKHDLSSLRVLGSVGEPINPEAWMWYHETIGGGRCPIVDTWWQTETGAIMISPLPGATTTKPGSATFPLPGIGAELVDEAGEPLAKGGGYLTLTRPWPSMLRGIYGDPERYQDTYWSRFPGRYFAGDGAKVDDDGYVWVLGRVDDVMNVSGHRISTTEVESALVDNPKVAEAAVVGAKDDTTGQAIIAFVTLRGGQEGGPEVGEELRQHVAKKIGAISRPQHGDLHRRPPQDPLREDHAPSPPRRGRGPRAGRHHDAGRPDRGRRDPHPRLRDPPGGVTEATSCGTSLEVRFRRASVASPAEVRPHGAVQERRGAMNNTLKTTVLLAGLGGLLITDRVVLRQGWGDHRARPRPGGGGRVVLVLGQDGDPRRPGPGR